MTHANARLTVYGRRLIVDRWRSGWRLLLAGASLAVDASGTPLVLVEDVLLGVTDQGVVVLGQDSRLWDGRLVTRDDGVVLKTRGGTPHRLGY